METKKEKFKRISSSRLNKVKEDIRKISNLSNKSIYEYDDNDVEHILNEIESECKKLRESFKSNGKIKNFRLGE